MEPEFDVVVVGLGVMGSTHIFYVKGATFYHLTKMGYRVLGLDQYETPHNLGSSGGITRSLRLVYYEEEHMAQYLRKSVEMW